MIQWTEWMQPDATRRSSENPLPGHLWRILTAKGMKAFMLTPDASQTAVKDVAKGTVRFLGNRKRTVVTNHRELADALREELKGWKIEAS